MSVSNQYLALKYLIPNFQVNFWCAGYGTLLNHVRIIMWLNSYHLMNIHICIPPYDTLNNGMHQNREHLFDFRYVDVEFAQIIGQFSWGLTKLFFVVVKGLKLS